MICALCITLFVPYYSLSSVHFTLEPTPGYNILDSTNQMSHAPFISRTKESPFKFQLHSKFLESEMTVGHRTIIVYPYKSLHLGHQQDDIKRD